MSRNKLRYVFGALTITAMALMLVLAFGRNASQVTESSPATDVAALQAENTKLNNTLQIMQQREQQYQTEIEQANGTIEQLVNDLNSAQTGQAAAAPSFLGDAQSALQNLFGDDAGFLQDDSGFLQDDSGFLQGDSAQSGDANQFARPFGHSHEGRRP